MLLLATPVVLAEIGWMTMGLVDTLMVGGLGPEAIGAVGIGTSLFMGVAIFAMGLLLGLDTLVSQAFGAGREGECHGWLLHGAALSLGLAVPVTLVLRLLSSGLDAWGLHPTVLSLLRPYLDALTWSVLPLLLYAAFRRYLQGMGVVRPVMAALVAANLLNLFANWVLIHGRLGAPALGVAGSAWATVIARIGMTATLLVVILYRERGRKPGVLAPPWRIDRGRMRLLVSLGLPAAMQITLEVGVFAAATALAGRLAPTSLAAHQIAINIVSFTFMVPLGVASAGAVRVGQAIGRRDHEGAARSGWTAILLGAVSMLGSAAVEGSVIEWVSTHRKHHRYSDQPGDPHSPNLEEATGLWGSLQGLAHAHVGWMFRGTDMANPARYSIAISTTSATASRSSPLTCQIGHWIMCATSVQYGVERVSRGDAVKPTWLLTTMCTVPPVR